VGFEQFFFILLFKNILSFLYSVQELMTVMVEVVAIIFTTVISSSQQRGSRPGLTNPELHEEKENVDKKSPSHHDRRKSRVHSCAFFSASDKSESTEMPRPHAWQDHLLFG
jgi:hypothetical protein